MADVLGSAAAVISLAILLSAAVSDWKKREASDLHWIAMMVMGIVLFRIRVTDGDFGLIAYLMPISMALMCFDLVWDRDGPIYWDILIYIGILVTTAVPAAVLWKEDIVWTYLSIPAIYLLMTFLYYTGIVRGGADAKAVISIAFVFPSYPDLGIFPLIAVPSGTVSLIAVPAFSMFFVAAALVFLLVVPYAAINIARHDIKMPQMLSGYRMDIEKARTSYVWPAEDVKDEKLVYFLSGTDDGEALDRLKEHGESRIWVTPIIPFLIPIAAAAAIVLLIGNPLFLFI